MTIRHLAYTALNDYLLKAVGMKLSLRIGSDPIADLRRLVPPDGVSTIIDGGAYEGTFSRGMAGVFPHAKIHAFEPTPASYALLQQKTKEVANIVPHRLALGAQSGTQIIFGNASPMTNSLRSNTADGERYFQSYVKNSYQTEVDVTTLQDFLRNEQLGSAAIIKLDLQGNELDAIVGLGVAIAGVQAFLLEVEFIRLYDGAALFTEVDAYLRERGFSLFQFYDLVRSPKDGRLLYGDSIFLRNELFSS